MDRKHVVGILSLYYNNRNYGGLLQAYALQKYISLNKIECEQICYNSKVNEKSIRLLRIKEQTGIRKIKSMLRYGQYQLSMLVNTLVGYSANKNLKKRISAFDNFQKAIPHSEKVYTEEEINQVNDRYDTFICGSDVIWNAGIPPYISCLGFVPEEIKKIAYAPSLGGNTLPEGWIKEYSKYLTGLDAVSVREESIKKCINREMPELSIETVADPTFLLLKEEWENELPSIDVREKYILCYLLGSSKQQREKIKKWAHTNQLKIITFPYIENNMYRTCDKNFGDIKDFDSDPLKFIALIKNAEIVITDSFHAVVFSLIFHTNFRAVYRTNGRRQAGMSGRIENLLKEVHMEDLLVDDENIESIIKNSELEFDYSDYIISEKRNISREYLLKNIYR